jgi:hypothetical protein
MRINSHESTEIRIMGENRIETYFRDPTLDRPSTDFYRVRLEWESIYVTEESVSRILSVIGGHGPPAIVRCETITGSVVYIRSDTVVLVHESTRAQRDAERRLWKELDKEDDDNDELDLSRG